MTNRFQIATAVLAATTILAACKPASEPAASPAVAAAPAAAAAAEDGPMECLAYIDLLRAAVKEGKASGDEAALKAASDAARAEAGKGMTADEVAQYYASSVAVFDDLSPEDLKRKAEACIAHPPAQPANP
ncbi:MAG: hypothetical protein K1X35_09780 [Caulobacteraceae bacterium]|nr:hypothetical protein [Caulobacteraceae bacterium]